MLSFNREQIPQSLGRYYCDFFATGRLLDAHRVPHITTVLALLAPLGTDVLLHRDGSC